MTALFDSGAPVRRKRRNRVAFRRLINPLNSPGETTYGIFVGKEKKGEIQYSRDWKRWDYPAPVQVSMEPFVPEDWVNRFNFSLRDAKAQVRKYLRDGEEKE